MDLLPNLRKDNIKSHIVKKENTILIISREVYNNITKQDECHVYFFDENGKPIGGTRKDECAKKITFNDWHDDLRRYKMQIFCLKEEYRPLHKDMHIIKLYEEKQKLEEIAKHINEHTTEIAKFSDVLKNVQGGDVKVERIQLKDLCCNLCYSYNLMSIVVAMDEKNTSLRNWFFKQSSKLMEGIYLESESKDEIIEMLNVKKSFSIEETKSKLDFLEDWERETYRFRSPFKYWERFLMTRPLYEGFIYLSEDDIFSSVDENFFRVRIVSDMERLSITLSNKDLMLPVFEKNPINEVYYKPVQKTLFQNSFIQRPAPKLTIAQAVEADVLPPCAKIFYNQIQKGATYPLRLAARTFSDLGFTNSDIETMYAKNKKEDISEVRNHLSGCDPGSMKGRKCNTLISDDWITKSKNPEQHYACPFKFNYWEKELNVKEELIEEINFIDNALGKCRFYLKTKIGKDSPHFSPSQAYRNIFYALEW